MRSASFGQQDGRPQLAWAGRALGRSPLVLLGKLGSD